MHTEKTKRNLGVHFVIPRLANRFRRTVHFVVQLESDSLLIVLFVFTFGCAPSVSDWNRLSTRRCTRPYIGPCTSQHISETSDGFVSDSILAPNFI